VLSYPIARSAVAWIKVQLRASHPQPSSRATQSIAFDQIQETNWNHLQVLRWSALGLGVFYGFTHQRGITSAQKAEHAQHAYDQKQKLIQQAKAEFAKKNNPTASASDGMLSGTVASIDCIAIH
jgi:F-type H+-transporting ATP synthase subunit e